MGSILESTSGGLLGALGHLLGLSWEGLGPLLGTLGVSWAASWPPWAAQDAAKKGQKTPERRFWAFLGACWALLVSFGPSPAAKDTIHHSEGVLAVTVESVCGAYRYIAKSAHLF